MNRRRFMELLGMATVGGAVAYSFPNIIVPKNIIISKSSAITWIEENYPKLIEDVFFTDSPFLSYLRDRTALYIGGEFPKVTFNVRLPNN
jgi:hypothetical protein